MPLNCAAIPDTLLESELFGHEKGAFTGAIARRQGCFELANRGTLFLDEIAEMTPTTQAKLLRVLQERTFRPLGGMREQSVDIRVIAATNVEPLEAVRQGKLREDLFYRLNVFAIRLPPLRDRKDDIPLLAQAFIKEFNARNSRVGRRAVATRRCSVIERYDWPGNVRELRNVMERVDDRGAGGALIDAGRSAAAGQPAAPTPRAVAAGRPHAGHDRRRGRAPADRGHAAAHGRQQDARRGDARHQPQDAAQQAQPDEGRERGLGSRELAPCA